MFHSIDADPNQRCAAANAVFKVGGVIDTAGHAVQTDAGVAHRLARVPANEVGYAEAVGGLQERPANGPKLSDL